MYMYMYLSKYFYWTYEKLYRDLLEPIDPVRSRMVTWCDNTIL